MNSLSAIVPTCLSIAGSDSGGGAGIQADLRTFAAHGVHGATVVTAVTAQNTQRVTATYPLPAAMIRAQLEAVFEDLEVAAAKTGMLGTEAVVRELAAFWKSLAHRPPLVVDPVLRSSAGPALLDEAGLNLLRHELLPWAALVTPNRAEAEALSGIEIVGRDSIEEAGRRILALGPAAVLLKGGHLIGGDFGDEGATDFLIDHHGLREFSSPRVAEAAAHGTGCTLSASICAHLARGLSTDAAVERAKQFVTEGIRHRRTVGHGLKPVHQFPSLEGW